MAHKHTQSQIDAVINMWRGKHAVEKMIAEYDGSKWSKYQRYRMEGGFIFHIATDTLKLTITPPDAKLEAKRAAKAEAKLAKEVKSGKVILDTFDARVTGNLTPVDKQNAKLVAAAKAAKAPKTAAAK
jgi:hypothetical protein